MKNSSRIKEFRERKRRNKWSRSYYNQQQLAKLLWKKTEVIDIDEKKT